jgi:hypothetical protein
VATLSFPKIRASVKSENILFRQRADLRPVSGPCGRVVATTPKGNRMSNRPLMLPLANAVSDLLPGIGLPRFAGPGSQRTYAAWPVWRDSTTKTVKFGQK